MIPELRTYEAGLAHPEAQRDAGPTEQGAAR